MQIWHSWSARSVLVDNHVMAVWCHVCPVPGLGQHIYKYIYNIYVHIYMYTYTQMRHLERALSVLEDDHVVGCA